MTLPQPPRMPPEPGVPAQSLGTGQKFFNRLTPLLPTVPTQEGTPGAIYHGYGVAELASAASWPRVLWVPSRDRFDPSRIATFALPSTGRAVKPYNVRLAGFSIYFHGQDTEMVENLLEDYLALMYAEGGTSFEVDGGQWLSEQKPEWLKDGEAYELSIAIAVPVVKVEHYIRLEAVLMQCGCGE